MMISAVVIWERKLNFMIVNFVLAFLPLVFFGLPLRFWNFLKKFKPLIYIFLVLGVLFLPNAPYLITDLMYIDLYNSGSFLEADSINILDFQPALESSLWGQVGFFWLSAAIGLYLNVVAIEKLFLNLDKLKMKISLDLLMLILAFINSFGVYLGRFLRFNSWDLFAQPINLIQTTFSKFVMDLSNVGFYAFFLNIFVLQIFMYLIVKSKKLEN